MSLELSGTIKSISEVEQGTSKAGKDWKKQTFVISNNEGYNDSEQIFAFEVLGEEAVANLTKYNKVGDVVKVNFNIRTNEWKDKFYTSLNSWRIEKAENTQTAETKQAVEDLPF
jgi:hypothetical protein